MPSVVCTTAPWVRQPAFRKKWVFLNRAIAKPVVETPQTLTHPLPADGNDLTARSTYLAHMRFLLTPQLVVSRAGELEVAKLGECIVLLKNSPECQYPTPDVLVQNSVIVKMGLL